MPVVAADMFDPTNVLACAIGAGEWRLKQCSASLIKQNESMNK